MKWWNDYRRFREQFREAMDQRFFPIEHLDSLIWSGVARLWVSENAAIVARLERFPSGILYVEGLIAAGDLDGIKALIPHAENWGREHGALFGKIESRAGWAREMKQDGYAPFQVALIKEL